jgi:hypothetical protein
MYYYKIMWECGYSGTDGYEVIESLTEMTDQELNQYAQEKHEEHCGEGWWELSTKEEYEDQ